jgi:hypothetical protein
VPSGVSCEMSSECRGECRRARVPRGTVVPVLAGAIPEWVMLVTADGSAGGASRRS